MNSPPPPTGVEAASQTTPSASAVPPASPPPPPSSPSACEFPALDPPSPSPSPDRSRRQEEQTEHATAAAPLANPTTLLSPSLSLLPSPRIRVKREPSADEEQKGPPPAVSSPPAAAFPAAAAPLPSSSTVMPVPSPLPPASSTPAPSPSNLFSALKALTGNRRMMSAAASRGAAGQMHAAPPPAPLPAAAAAVGNASVAAATPAAHPGASSVSLAPAAVTIPAVALPAPSASAAPPSASRSKRKAVTDAPTPTDTGPPTTKKKARKKDKQKQVDAHPHSLSPDLARFARPTSALAAEAAAKASAELEDDLDFDLTGSSALPPPTPPTTAAPPTVAAAAASSFSLSAASDASSCPICLSPFTSHGAHRVCCLKCGHLYGASCIRRWLTDQKKCPSCKAAAKPADIRNLFVPAIPVVDTSKLHAAQQQIQTLQQEISKQQEDKKTLHEELRKMHNKYENLAVSFQRLQEKLIITRRNGNGSSDASLTYIMSPQLSAPPAELALTAAPSAASSSASSSAPLSPSRFQYMPLILPPKPQPQSLAPHLPSSPVPSLTPVRPPMVGNPPVNGATHLPPVAQSSSSLAAASPHQPMPSSHRSTPGTLPRPSQPPAQVASAAAFLQTRTSGHPTATTPTPSSSSSAPVLPLMSAPPPVSKPKPAAGVNELLFPLLDVFSIEGGRCVEFDSAGGHLLLSSCPSQYPSLQGLTHGLMRVAVQDVRTRFYLPLHSKPIRDLHYHAENKLLLSCSFDKTLKLAELESGRISSSFDLPQPAWSCTWNSWQSHMVHVGLQTGQLLTFDIRMPQPVPLFSLQLPHKQPVHSLCSIGGGGGGGGGDMQQGANQGNSSLYGLLAATGAQVSFSQSTPTMRTWELFDCPLLPAQPASGGMSCGSLAYDRESGVGLCALRPSLLPPPAPLGSNGLPAAPLVQAPLCTVFRLEASQAAASSTPVPSSSLFSRPPRWSVALQTMGRVQFETSRQLPSASASAGVSCSCLSQLSGHRSAASLTRATLFTLKEGGTGGTSSKSSSSPAQLLVACGDEENQQCVVWDAGAERVRSRLTGQTATITQVQHSSSLRMLATVSNQACCLYSTAAA